jgi:nicotinamidase-related amidase
VPDQPKIPLATTAVVLNDMINSNLVSSNSATQKIINDSKIVENTANLIAAARARGIRIVWILIERRADLADQAPPLTDSFIADGMKLPPAITAGSSGAKTPDALPVQPEDLTVFKVRYDAFVGTNLDLLLRGNKIDTILLGGVATNYGVESTARTARELNYNVVVLTDCCLNVAREHHDFTLKNILPRFARIMTSEQALGLLE